MPVREVKNINTFVVMQDIELYWAQINLGVSNQVLVSNEVKKVLNIKLNWLE